MFVVVHLVDVKKRIIVPENFIFDLSQENLKNNGCNKNFTYLAYWSHTALGDENSAPNINCQPNFTAPISKIFPPGDDLQEACYTVRLKKFFGKFCDNF